MIPAIVVLTAAAGGMLTMMYFPRHSTTLALTTILVIIGAMLYHYEHYQDFSSSSSPAPVIDDQTAAGSSSTVANINMFTANPHGELYKSYNGECSRPTRENAMANPVLMDNNVGRRPTCPVQLTEAESNAYINGSLSFDNVQSRRALHSRFVTVPDTTLAGEGFASWCYRGDETCKTDQDKCDGHWLRTHRAGTTGGAAP